MILAKSAKSEPKVSETLKHVRWTARMYSFTYWMYWITVNSFVAGGFVVTGLLFTAAPIDPNTVYAFLAIARACTELTKNSHQTVSEKMKGLVKRSNQPSSPVEPSR